MHRLGSARLRSSLTKMDQDGVEVKRRRAQTNSNNNNNNNHGQVSVNGNGGSGSTSRSGGPRTRGMEADADDVMSVSDVNISNSEPLIEVSDDRDGDHNTAVDESSASSSSDSSDSSDSEDSSEMDEGTCETKRVEYQDDLCDLEKQFLYMREMLYKERLKHVEDKIEEVNSGKAREYLNPLEQLTENMRIRIEVAGKLRSYRMINLQNKYEAEELASFQNFESEKALLRDEIKTDLEEKINRLEEDRNNDFTSELWLETALKRKNKKTIDIFGEKRKKPITVTGPYIVYMLNDVDIVEDWTIIKKAMAAPKRKYLEIGTY